MGRIVEQVVTKTVYRLVLTREDFQKHKERETARQKRVVHPDITQHEKQFAERLVKCPVCGKAPHYLKTSGYAESGYEYKLVCDSHSAETAELEWGGWYKTPSRAGADWNKRAVRVGTKLSLHL